MKSTFEASRQFNNYELTMMNLKGETFAGFKIQRCSVFYFVTGAIIGDGDRKFWDARGPMIWDNFSIFRTNCAILTSYIRANPRTCRGFSRGSCHVSGSNVESCLILSRIFQSDGRE